MSLVDGEPQISGSGSATVQDRGDGPVDDLPVLSGDAGRPTWGFLPSKIWNKSKLLKGRFRAVRERRLEQGHQHHEVSMRDR